MKVTYSTLLEFGCFPPLPGLGIPPSLSSFETWMIRLYLLISCCLILTSACASDMPMKS
jgi:hypothetical protein